MKLSGNSLFGFLIRVALIISIFTLSQLAFSQSRWGIELRTGMNLPTTQLGETELNTGFGIEGTLSYRFMQHLGVYAGWGWNKFGSDSNLNGSSLDFEETGYTYGLRFIHPFGSSNISYLISAGGLYNHIEVEDGNDIISDSGHGFGWQAAGGIVIKFNEKWSLAPSLRYRSLASNLDIENIQNDVNLNYLSVGIGISRKF